MAYAEHALNALWAEAAAQILQQGGKDGGRLTSSGEAGGFGGRGKGGGGDGSGSLLPRPLWLATWRACSCVASLGGALTLLASATAAAGSCPPPRQGAASSPIVQQAGGGELVLVPALLAFLHRMVRSPLPGAALPPASEQQGAGTPPKVRAAAGGVEGEGSGSAAMAELRIRILEAVQCSCRSLAQAAGVSAAVRGLLVAPPAWRAGAGGGGAGADGLPDASSLAEAVLRECESARRAAGGGSK